MRERAARAMDNDGRLQQQLRARPLPSAAFKSPSQLAPTQAAYDKVPELNLARERALATQKRQWEAEVAELRAKLAGLEGGPALPADSAHVNLAELEAEVAALRAALSAARESAPENAAPLLAAAQAAAASSEQRAQASEQRSSQLYEAALRIRGYADALGAEVGRL